MAKAVFSQPVDVFGEMVTSVESSPTRAVGACAGLVLITDYDVPNELLRNPVRQCMVWPQPGSSQYFDFER